ncbi:guanine nucleotide binding protein, alpha subunit [Pisolithus croceorrhizus]|nr:guanine nucleotide binding protein, alpha subunit [Pisolithus croceorrhizus]
MPLEPNRRRSLSDPLSVALQPPENETPADRDRRLLAEQEAKQVSDRIDEMLREEKKEKRLKPEIKILLLGQSESGKSTTLKQFQLVHAPAAFHADRLAWRAVIYLNLVRSILRILDAVSPDADPPDDGHGVDLWPIASNRTTGTRVAKYEYYRRALEPLREFEERLIRMLSAPDEVEPVRIAPSKPDWNLYDITTSSSSLTSRSRRPSPVITIPHRRKPSSLYSPTSPNTTQNLPSPCGSSSSSSKSKQAEVSVHTTSNWKRAFSLANKIKSTKGAHTNEVEGWWDDPSDPVHVVNACSQAMSGLWKDPNVKQRLRELKLRIEESSGFFLDEISRVTALRYFPTDQDVLKARLKTLGVVEHSFSIPDCHLNAIIFLAPISAFDQTVRPSDNQDSRVNRLEDSFLLWKSLVSNKLLTNAKLRSGVRLRDHIPHYGDRPNDYDNVSKYFYNKFGSLHQEFSAKKERELKIHFTSVTDTRRTVIIIKNGEHLFLIIGQEALAHFASVCNTATLHVRLVCLS